MEVCLNSLSSGYPVARSRMRSMRVAGQLAVARRVGGEAHEHGLVADDERGDAPHVVVERGGLVLLAHGVERGTIGDLGEHHVGVDAVGHEQRRARCPRRGAWRARGGRRRASRCTARKASGKRSRTTTPARRASRPESSSGRSQIGRVAFGDVHLTEAERQEGDVPVGACRETVEQVQVGEAGEGAAVVPGDGKGGHATFNDGCVSNIPDRCHAAERRQGAGHHRRAARAMPMPMTAPATTSDAWCMRVWMRLLDTMTARA